jgi:hypothetical protein
MQFKKIVAQKINVILFFDRIFLKYFFRVLHEARSSWLKFLHNFQKHPVYSLTSSITPWFQFLYIFSFLLFSTSYFSVVYLMNVVLEAKNSNLWKKSNCFTKESCCISGTGFGICLAVSPAGLSELALVLNRLKPLKS